MTSPPSSEAPLLSRKPSTRAIELDLVDRLDAPGEGYRGCDVGRFHRQHGDRRCRRPLLARARPAEAGKGPVHASLASPGLPPSSGSTGSGRRSSPISASWTGQFFNGRECPRRQAYTWDDCIIPEETSFQVPVGVICMAQIGRRRHRPWLRLLVDRVALSGMPDAITDPSAAAPLVWQRAGCGWRCRRRRIRTAVELGDVDGDGKAISSSTASTMASPAWRSPPAAASRHPGSGPRACRGPPASTGSSPSPWPTWTAMAVPTS